MPRTTTQIVHDIDQFVPVDGSWTHLDVLIGELFRQPITSECIAAALRVFERFPTEHGGGVLWSIVHGLESHPDYESHLVASVRRRPSELGVIMLHRILKIGQKDAGGVSIHSILSTVAASSEVEPSTWRYAEKFMQTSAALP
jgi:hypothetical protein